MSDETLVQLARDKALELITSAARDFGVALHPPQIRFDLKGKAAGMVRFPAQGPWIIRFNREMLIENGQAFIDQTVPHEVAHLIARVVHGPSIKPHGIEWRALMHHFGVKPKRCHAFAVPRRHRRRMRLYPYHCRCKEHQLSAIRHNRCLTGIVYVCRSCGQPLSLTETR